MSDNDTATASPTPLSLNIQSGDDQDRDESCLDETIAACIEMRPSGSTAALDSVTY
jgi:hypothetical protein